jgi:predicted GTPase
MCEVYGKLIAATLVSLLKRATVIKMGHIVISRIKATKTIKSHAAMLASAVMKGKKAILIVIKKITASMGRLCRKSYGKTRPMIEQLLENSFGGSSGEMAA